MFPETFDWVALIPAVTKGESDSENISDIVQGEFLSM